MRGCKIHLNNDGLQIQPNALDMKTRIGVSACLLGRACNFNGKDLLSDFVRQLPEIAQVEFVSFCPEDSVLGTPRPNLRIVGGDGYDVLNGTAQVQ